MVSNLTFQPNIFEVNHTLFLIYSFHANRKSIYYDHTENTKETHRLSGSSHTMQITIIIAIAIYVDIHLH